VLFNYTRTDAQLVGNGSIESDALRGGVYASVFGGGAYLNAYLGGGHNDYDTRRAGLLGTARGNTTGSEFSAFLAAGYDKRVGSLTIGPVATYHYTSTDTDSFRERGSLAPLRIDSMEGYSSRTNLGARASFNWNLGGMVLVPEIRATWQHEFGDVEQTTDARLAFGGPSFSVNSARVGRDSFQLSTGFALQITPDIAAYAYYDGELGRSNYDAHNIIGGVRANF
jgi:outer membrane autotransporter protein